MSRVFLATDLKLGRRIVVKVLPQEVTHTVSAARFAREIQFLARLQHPNIVPVLAADVAGDVPWYTMPFVEGESLRSRLDRDEQIPGSDALAILRDVARALAYAHGLGVVHRDIKPENVLLAYDAAVVADFGIAKALAAATTAGASGSPLTLTRDSAPGTPAYMSPEQASGDPGIDHRADVYAWGILAYELLTGVHPFAGRKTVHELVTAHLVELPKPLREVADGIPQGVSDLVMRCLAKDPADRPSNARDIADALHALLNRVNTPVLEDKHRSRRRVRLSTRSGAIAAAVAFGVAGFWYITSSWPRQRTAATAAAAQNTMPAVSSPAKDLYLRGKILLGRENRVDTDSAIAVLREAVRIDPSLAPAYAELSRAYSIKGFYFAADSDKKRITEEAELAADKALALDPRLAAAHVARARLLWTPGRKFPHEQTVMAYRQAIALDSTLDEAHHQLALVYLHIGLLDKAKLELDKALELNPANTLARFRIGVMYLYRSDFERAYAVFNSTPLERNPSLWAFQTATVLFRLGREREATELIDKFLKEYPDDEGGVGHSVRAMMLAQRGRRQEAELTIAKSIELGGTFGHFHHAAYNVASAYAILGNKDQALKYLENAADNGFPCYPLFRDDALLEGIRTHPGYLALMTRLEKEWNERSRAL